MDYALYPKIVKLTKKTQQKTTNRKLTAQMILNAPQKKQNTKKGDILKF